MHIFHMYERISNHVSKHRRKMKSKNHLPILRSEMPGYLTFSYCRTSTLLHRYSLQFGDGQFGGGQKSVYDIGLGGSEPNTASSEYVRVG